MNAVIYTRYSSDNQTEESIAAQTRACTEYATRKNLMVIETYIDRAMSARSDARPEFQRMIDDSKRKHFKYVIVHKLDRFSRDRYDHAIYKKELRKNGVRLLSVLENLDDSPESVVLESVLEGFSEYFSRNLARETRKGLKEVALQGKLTGGKPPFGYNVDEENYFVINEIEAQAVRRIFDACRTGVGYGKLLDEFAAEGIKTKMGKPFAKTSFNAILKNEKYIGRYIYYPEGTKRDKLGDPIIIEDAVPAIVDKLIFLEVQDIMNTRKHTGRLRAIEPYLLSGVAFCGECGAPMTGHRRTKNGKSYYEYECAENTRRKTCNMGTIARDKVEDAVCEYIQALLSSDTAVEVMQYLKDNYKQIQDAQAAHIAALDRELSSLDTRINNTVELLIEAKSDALKAKLADMEERKAQLKLERDQLATAQMTPERVDEYTVKLDNFADLDRTQKQLHIKNIIKKVTIYKNGDLKIETTYKEVVAKLGGTTQT